MPPPRTEGRQTLVPLGGERWAQGKGGFYLCPGSSRAGDPAGDVTAISGPGAIPKGTFGSALLG